VAKVYGARWQLSSGKPLGRGGQAEVFRVTDLRGEYSGEYALKRILNPARHERFQREVQAIESIRHPNVIKLIDHSAFAATPEEVEKQFLVMPIAEGGDLGEARRIALYKDSIDNVIQVGKQLVSSLAAAHAVDVIHRDVKPENILFTGIGNEIWLSDFGICLLRNLPRLSDPGDILGARQFLAPELEDGNLVVTPAADVYSFGKVLYYLISGGVILPRERLSESPFNEIFKRGERHFLLYSLLQQMICPIGQRIKSMREVGERLDAIEAWEKTAQVLPLSPEAIGSIQKLRLKARENVRAVNEEKDARQQELDRLQDAQNGFGSWMRSELQKTAAFVHDSSGLKCQVCSLNGADMRWVPRSSNGGFFRVIGGLGLSLESTGVSTDIGDVLIVGLCIEERPKVIVHTNQFASKTVEPPQDYQLAMIPVLRGASSTRRQTTAIGFFTRRAIVGEVRGVIPAAGRMPYVGPMTPVTPEFILGVSQIVEFRVSEWPTIIAKLQPALQEAIGSFIAFVEALA
jgi:serine/threonine protein kinase